MNEVGYSSLAILIGAIIFLFILFEIGMISENFSKQDKAYFDSLKNSPSSSSGPQVDDRDDCFFTDDSGKYTC